MKSNHSSGQVKIVRNKAEEDETKMQQIARKWLSSNHYTISKEPQYKSILPKILVEKLLLNNDSKIPFDYKFHCFDGRVEFIQVDIDRFENHKRNYYSRDWKLLPFMWSLWSKQGPRLKPGGIVKKPVKLQEMINIAETLSKGYPYLRVDLYDVENKIYFGELTLHHGGGWKRFSPEKYDRYYGDMVDLTKI